MLQIIIDWLPEHFLIGAISIIIYVLTTRARREKRQPAFAVAWVMGLALLPYIFLPIYIIFGQRKVNIHVHLPEYKPNDIKLSHWAADMVRSFDLPPASMCDVNMHKDGKESLEGLYRVIESAQSSIDICMFIFAKDSFTKEFLEKLYTSLEKGVKVRMLIDALGSFRTSRRFFKKFKKLGGELRIFRPLSFIHYTGPINLRNHRKIVVSDGVYLWSGGRNLADKYFLGKKSKTWLDLSFDLKGEVALIAAYQTNMDYAAAYKHQPEYTKPQDKNLKISSNSYAQFLPSGPDQMEDTVNSLFISALYRASEYFTAITPYFIPDANFIDALRLASRRGVVITIVTPSNSDHAFADFARARSMRELAKFGVRFILLPYMCHAKAVVSDDSFALCGSVNLDQRSLMINYEASVLFYSQKEIKWLKEWIAQQERQGKLYEPKKVGIFRDVAEGVILALGYQL